MLSPPALFTLLALSALLSAPTTLALGGDSATLSHAQPARRAPAAAALPPAPAPGVQPRTRRQAAPPGIAWDPLGYALLAGEAFLPSSSSSPSSSAPVAQGGPRRLPPSSEGEGDEEAPGQGGEGEERGEDEDDEEGEWDDGVEGDMLSEEGWLRRRRRRHRQRRSVPAALLKLPLGMNPLTGEEQ